MKITKEQIKRAAELVSQIEGAQRDMDSIEKSEGDISLHIDVSEGSTACGIISNSIINKGLANGIVSELLARKTQELNEMGLQIEETEKLKFEPILDPPHGATKESIESKPSPGPSFGPRPTPLIEEKLRKEIGSKSPGEICDIITDLILRVEEIENKEIHGVKFSKIKSIGGPMLPEEF